MRQSHHLPLPPDVCNESFKIQTVVRARTAFLFEEIFLFREGTQLNCEIKLWNLTNCCEIVELSHRHLPAPLHCRFISWNILEKREEAWGELPLAKHRGSSNVRTASMSQISDPVHSKRAGSSQKFLSPGVPPPEIPLAYKELCTVILPLNLQHLYPSVC